MNENELRGRTKQFGIRVIRAVRALPATAEGQVIGRQLLRAGTAVGANYRAACRSRSRAEFCAKMGIVEEEADEVGYWFELIADIGLMDAKRLGPLWREASEIVAIAAASRKSARRGGSVKKSGIANGGLRLAPCPD
jgi:four helix bundle protein